jgi:hypothetical protein
LGRVWDGRRPIVNARGPGSWRWMEGHRERVDHNRVRGRMILRIGWCAIRTRAHEQDIRRSEDATMTSPALAPRESGRLERRKARTRAAILSAASGLFLKNGYETPPSSRLRSWPIRAWDALRVLRLEG